MNKGLYVREGRKLVGWKKKRKTCGEVYRMQVRKSKKEGERKSE